MRPMHTRRAVLGGLAGFASAAAAGTESVPRATAGAGRDQTTDSDAAREAYRRWRESLPVAPAPELRKHGLVATELQRWPVLEANQGVAVDARHFYGIGNHVLVKHRKDTGERVAEWVGARGGPIVHFNAGYVDGHDLVLAHSNFPQLPMASSLETYDAGTLQPRATHSFGIRLGSLTWAVRRRRWWWACFANYNDTGTTPGFDQRWTHVCQFDDAWQVRQSWLFPPQVVATWGPSSSSGGDWGDDGLLYVTGHDAPELYVLRLPRQGVALEYVTTIDVPFEGQGWAWDFSARGERVIYGISRARQQVVAARIPPIPADVLA
jgi:hypothetical protein